ncbi:DUF134 domain-containing protein [Geomonas subterranea]|uniref:DUF134 domain-containing protein n=1 Tax=Geomonas subterranea TaxID=2847989 RepID=A0ABX8LH64_9BACT|nr:MULTISPECIES: DUF134 domain-containing protein [Geomonas]QXE90072.1 DUF134 domain-containing protein [Geomonas subterranea]QXM07806.1 DUF134 domain-containing protein [Geomonas subterranea]
MPRPRKPRTCICPHRSGFAALFKPAGIPLSDLDLVRLAHDELDALHLCDGQGKTQEQAGVCMGVSRGTVQRLLAAARSKVAQALVQQKALAISAGWTGDDASTACPPGTWRSFHGFPG